MPEKNNEAAKPKKALLESGRWLPQAATAIGAAIVGAAVAVLAGWWGGLSRAMLREIEPQLLLNTVGILALLCVVLGYSLAVAARGLEQLKRKPVITRGELESAKTSRLVPLQEALLIAAADSNVTQFTLSTIKHIHEQESKYHYDALFGMSYIESDGGSARRLTHKGRDYLLQHNLMPPPKEKNRPAGPIP